MINILPKSKEAVFVIVSHGTGITTDVEHRVDFGGREGSLESETLENDSFVVVSWGCRFDVYHLPIVGDAGTGIVGNFHQFVFEAGNGVNVAEDLGEAGLVDVSRRFPLDAKVYRETQESAKVYPLEKLKQKKGYVRVWPYG